MNENIVYMSNVDSEWILSNNLCGAFAYIFRFSEIMNRREKTRLFAPIGATASFTRTVKPVNHSVLRSV